MAEQDEHLRELVAEVAAAYFANSHVSPSDIPNVIAQIAGSLTSVGLPVEEAAPAPQEAPAPAKLSRSQIQKSITPDALISFEDGKPYKTLRRHLAVRSLTPEQYREKWGLARDYPMVAPNYSEQRKALAQKIGLGRKPAQAAAEPAAAKPARGRKPRAEAPAAPARRGRPPRAASE
jgi:predicted transcriptional regulator